MAAHLEKPDQVLAVLAAGKPGDLIGTPESSQIDFKREPYALDSEKGKWELGKDIAGLANLSGGVIILGVRAEKTAGNFLEVATELRPVPVSQLDRAKYHNIIRDLVRPAVNYEVAYHPDATQSDKGYMSILVAPLAEADRWAIVRRMVNDEDKSVEGIGVPVRDSDQTRWLSGDEVYRLIRDGQRSNAAPMAPVPTSDGAPVLNPQEAIDRLIAFKDWAPPILIWQSIPKAKVDLLPQLWGPEGLMQSVSHPQSIRDWGFNWRFLNNPSQFEDGLLGSDGRHAFWLRDDGLVTAAATVADILSWGMGSPIDGLYRINLLAMAEMTLEYYRLVDNFIIPKVGVAYDHRIVTLGFADQSPVEMSFILPPATPIEYSRAVRDIARIYPSSGDPERDSYEALKWLFAIFKLGADRIPFTENDEKVNIKNLIGYANALHKFRI